MEGFLYYLCLVLGSLFMFLQGFFPIQQNQAGYSTTEQVAFVNNDHLNASTLHEQEIDRLVLVVIDALRTDFVTKVNMPFLSSAYFRKGCFLSVKVESPTVTLPRIKALTTGSIPQFVDIILNLASTEVLKDSLLHNAANAGKKIVFYGDDTWLKLYPKIFNRHEGVSSFFVNDYTEVDENVTQNVLKELDQDDWDVMVLHYLGLDHIGHVYGPYSHLIQPKLQEMDNVIREIALSAEKWSRKTLIGITGDHGMKDSGGHGGSSPSETHVPFISLGLSCTNDSISQTDIPSTLAVLMGLEIPTSSVGRVIANMLIGLPVERLLHVLRYSTILLHSKLEIGTDLFERASVFHEDYLKTNNESSARTARQLYDECGKKISETLIHSSVQQNVNNLLVSTAILVYCFCLIFRGLIETGLKHKYPERIFVTFVLLSQFQFRNLFGITCLNLFVMGMILLNNLKSLMQICLSWKPSYNLVFLICGSIAHLVSLLSSSLIEEEHQVWYFFWGTFVLLRCYSTLDKFQTVQWFLLFFGVRFLRTLNQTGDKWAHLPDLAQWLLSEDNYIYLQLTFCVGLFLILICFHLCLHEQNVLLVLSSITLILIYIFRTCNPQNSVLGKLIWFMIFMRLTLGLLLDKKCFNSITAAWILSCALLFRSYNIILLPACILASAVIKRYVTDITVLTLAHIWLGRTLFFCQGHSNSLASVDIATGYVGLQEYIPVIVITQVLCHTYAFPVLCNFLILGHDFMNVSQIWTINLTARLPILIVTCASILIQRHHLFVWTVFAPKLLIESCNIVILLVEIALFYCVVSIKHIFVENKGI